MHGSNFIFYVFQTLTSSSAWGTATKRGQMTSSARRSSCPETTIQTQCLRGSDKQVCSWQCYGASPFSLFLFLSDRLWCRLKVFLLLLVYLFIYLFFFLHRIRLRLLSSYKNRLRTGSDQKVQASVRVRLRHHINGCRGSELAMVPVSDLCFKPNRSFRTGV